MVSVVNVERLKTIIKEKRLTYVEVARALNMDKSTFFRKLKNNGDGFTVKEIRMMVDNIPLTNEEAMSIFFEHEVA